MKYSSYSSHIVWVVLISQNILWTTSSLSHTLFITTLWAWCCIIRLILQHHNLRIKPCHVQQFDKCENDDSLPYFNSDGRELYLSPLGMFFFVFCKDKRDASVQLVFHPIYSEVSIGQPKHTDSSAALFVCVHLPSITLRLPPRQQPVSVDGLVHTDPVSTPATPGTLCALSQASGRSGKARKGQGTKGQLLAKHWLYIEGSRAYWIYWMHVIHLFIVCLFQTEN